MNYPFGSPWKPIEIPGEIFTQPSMTIPDQAMSIAEILQRFTRGLPIGGARVPFYEEDDSDDVEDTMPQNMDKIERIEYMRANQQRIQSLQKDLNSINEKQARSQAAEKNPISVKTPPEEKIN